LKPVFAGTPSVSRASVQRFMRLWLKPRVISAEDLYRMVKRQQPMMSRNTVYYTLGVLRNAGLVREVNVGHDMARYDGNVRMHHHLICLGCGQIMDVMDDDLNQLQLSSGQARGFDVVGHRVEFHGYCVSCQQAERNVSPRRT